MRRGTDAAQQLKALKSEFDSLRSHLTCKVCDRLLYQPYTIACGHTYCYTVRCSWDCRTVIHVTNRLQCLCTWFSENKQNRQKLTCPDCRVIVQHLPAPAYVVSDAVL